MEIQETIRRVEIVLMRVSKNKLMKQLVQEAGKLSCRKATLNKWWHNN